MIIEFGMNFLNFVFKNKKKGKKLKIYAKKKRMKRKIFVKKFFFSHLIVTFIFASQLFQIVNSKKKDERSRLEEFKSKNYLQN